MKIPIYQIDAFANNPFEGNPAAVCPLNNWLPSEVMQLIAEENNLSETAFFVPTKKGFHIRWFTPISEIDLCGHATLASAYVIFNCLNFSEKVISFESKSGILKVSKNEDLLVMDFPAQSPVLCQIPEEIKNAFGSTPIECLKSEDYIVVFNNENEVLSAHPDFSALSRLDLRGVAITAKSSRYDFVTRFFAPKFGINEDPVTGSAYTQLIPYWSNILGITELHSKQISRRGGEVLCKIHGSRVSIAGKAIKYLEGEIKIKNLTKSSS